MPSVKPIKREKLIYYLKRFGFSGTFSGGKHQFMIKSDITVRIPNPHGKDISIDLLIRILKHAGIKKAEWEIL